MNSPAKNPSPDRARPRLTDPRARDHARARASRLGHADFLHRIAAAEIEDRLAEINKSFSRAAIITDFPRLWAEYFPAGAMIPSSETLDLPQGLDLVIHAMTLHWADDPVGQIIQSAAALRPDGLFLAVCPGGETLAELRSVLSAAEIAQSGGLSPRVLPMGEIRDMGALLGRAGLALPVADHLRQTVSYRDLFHLAADLRAMGETNAMEARLRTPPPRAIFAEAAADYAARFPDPDDPARIRATFDLIFLTGWKPAPGQQQPLRPGSAQMRLADALGPEKASPPSPKETP
ncbi:MAG: SAM-dependent methyltransferase [Paracoccus sp. (in: a-proteobacteria)]|nr:SAM-dependent methyltransferase [Paracoccus sp. (in: a-proteobacteria)]